MIEVLLCITHYVNLNVTFTLYRYNSISSLTLLNCPPVFNGITTSNIDFSNYLFFFRQLMFDKNPLKHYPPPLIANLNIVDYHEIIGSDLKCMIQLRFRFSSQKYCNVLIYCIMNIDVCLNALTLYLQSLVNSSSEQQSVNTVAYWTWQWPLYGLASSPDGSLGTKYWTRQTNVLFSVQILWKKTRAAKTRVEHSVHCRGSTFQLILCHHFVVCSPGALRAVARNIMPTLSGNTTLRRRINPTSCKQRKPECPWSTGLSIRLVIFCISSFMPRSISRTIQTYNKIIKPSALLKLLFFTADFTISVELLLVSPMQYFSLPYQCIPQRSHSEQSVLKNLSRKHFNSEENYLKMLYDSPPATQHLLSSGTTTPIDSRALSIGRILEPASVHLNSKVLILDKVRFIKVYSPFSCLIIIEINESFYHILPLLMRTPPSGPVRGTLDSKTLPITDNLYLFYNLILLAYREYSTHDLLPPWPPIIEWAILDSFNFHSDLIYMLQELDCFSSCPGQVCSDDLISIHLKVTSRDSDTQTGRLSMTTSTNEDSVINNKCNINSDSEETPLLILSIFLTFLITINAYITLEAASQIPCDWLNVNCISQMFKAIHKM